MTTEDSRSIWPAAPWMILPVAPFFVAVVLLNLIGGDAFNLANAATGDSFVGLPESAGMGRDMIVYAAFALVQISVCVALLAVSIRALSAAPPAARVAGRSVAVALTILIVGAIAVEQLMFGQAATMTYHNTCEILLKGQGAPHVTPTPVAGLLPTDCMGDISRLAWLVYLPFGLGLLASGFASAATARAAFPIKGDNWRRAFEDEVAAHQVSVYLTAAVLVTSTAAMLQFYRLPLETLPKGDLRDGVAAYASGMAFFWGAVFTLTLAAIYTPAALALRRNLRNRMAEEETVAEWASDIEFLKLRRQIGAAAAVLGPLLVGPAGALLQSLTGIGG